MDLDKRTVKQAKTICMLSALFLPHLGGVERIVHLLSIHLKKIGYNILIISSNTENSPDYEVLDGIHVFRLPVWRLLNGRFPIPIPSPKLFYLLKKALALCPDVFVLNTRFYLMSLIAIALHRKTKKDLILFEHVSGHFTVNNLFWDTLGHLYEHWISYLVKTNISKAIGNCEAVNLWLKHFNIKSDGIVYNSVNSNFVIKNPVDLRKKFNLELDSVIIAFAGRLIEEKGIINLINAFNKISSFYPNAFLFIAGSGNQTDFVVNSSINNNHILYLGQLDYDQTMNLLKETNILALPSFYSEGLPTIILEAGMYNCAVISSNAGGVKEVINNNINGILINPNNLDELFSSLEELIVNPELRNTFAKELNNNIMEKFTWNNSALNFINQINL